MRLVRLAAYALHVDMWVILGFGCLGVGV
jgi:hypothetical protein